MWRSRLVLGPVWGIRVLMLAFALVSPGGTRSEPGPRMSPGLFPRECRILEPDEIPAVLYHWLSQESLERLATEPGGGGILPLKPSTRTAAATLCPPLQGRRCLFAWSNPVTGMGASKEQVLTGVRRRGNEAYAAFEEVDREGRRKASQGPRALRLIVSPRARAMRVVTSVKEPRPPPPADLDRCDLIQHVMYEHLTDERPRLQEWIILDHAGILSFTADPEVIAADLRSELERMRQPGFRYPDDERHYLDGNPYNEPAIVAPYVERVLRSIESAGDRSIPARFRGRSPSGR